MTVMIVPHDHEAINWDDWRDWRLHTVCDIAVLEQIVATLCCNIDELRRQLAQLREELARPANAGAPQEGEQ